MHDSYINKLCRICFVPYLIVMKSKTQFALIRTQMIFHEVGIFVDVDGF